MDVTANDIDMLIKIQEVIMNIKDMYIQYYIRNYYDFKSLENLNKKYAMLKSLSKGNELTNKGYEYLFEKLPKGAKFTDEGIKIGDKVIVTIID